MPKFKKVLYIVIMGLSALLIVRTVYADVNKKPSIDYLLDDSIGNEYALYSGNGYRSYVKQQDMISSFKDLENRVSNFPKGARLHWLPFNHDSSGKPVLFSHDGDLFRFKNFCRDHHIDFIIVPPGCKAKEDCETYCIARYMDTQCLAPQGICRNSQCNCDTPVCR